MSGRRRAAGLAAGVALASWLTAGAQPPAETEAPTAAAEEESVATIPVAQPAEAAPDAEADDSTRLDDITVTATKRTKAQREIPASIQALRGDYLEKINAKGMQDYLKLTPGVNFVEYGQDRSIPVIRGIATSTNFGFTPLGVGVFIDDMPFNDLFRGFSIADLNPFDLERVEVLKGPQSTLFGAGALSGAIRFIANKPDFGVWNGKLQGAYSTNDFGEPSSSYAGALNLPLYRDEAALRLVGVFRQDGGLIDQVGDPIVTRNEEDINRLDQFTGRVVGAWDVSDRLDLQLLGFLQQTDTKDIVSSSVPDRFERGNSPLPTRRNSDLEGANLTARYGFDFGELISSSSYVGKYTDDLLQNVALGVESANGPLNPPGDVCCTDAPQDDPGTEDQNRVDNPAFLDSEVTGYVQELRLASPGGDSPWEWLVGLAYMDYAQLTHQRAPVTGLNVVDTTRDGNGLGGCPVPLVCPIPTPLGSVQGDEYRFSNFTYDADIGREEAVFGEVTRSLFGDRLELTAGGRLFRNTLGVTITQRGIQAITLLQRIEYTERRKYSEGGFNPKFSALYRFNRAVQTYVLAARGFQFGGVQSNPNIIGFNQAAAGGFLPYKSSILWNYELGLRTEFFDRRLRWDTVLFHQDWKDLQLTQIAYATTSTQNEIPGAGVPEVDRETQRPRQALFAFTTNIGRAKSQGVEMALQIVPVRGLSLTSNAAWIKAVTTEDFQGADGFFPAGTRLPGSSRFSIATVLSYDTPFNFLGAWEGGLGLTHTHTGSYFSQLAATVRVGGYDTMDFDAHLLKPDWKFTPDLGFSIKNLGDVRGLGQAFTANARDPEFYLIRPRTAVLSLALRF